MMNVKKKSLYMITFIRTPEMTFKAYIEYFIQQHIIFFLRTLHIIVTNIFLSSLITKCTTCYRLRDGSGTSLDKRAPGLE